MSFISFFGPQGVVTQSDIGSIIFAACFEILLSFDIIAAGLIKNEAVCQGVQIVFYRIDLRRFLQYKYKQFTVKLYTDFITDFKIYWEDCIMNNLVVY